MSKKKKIPRTVKKQPTQKEIDEQDLIIRQRFEQLFRDFDHCFDTSIAKLASVSEEKRKEYYRKASELQNNIVHQIESEEIIRSFITFIAMQSKDDREGVLMRGGLMILKRLNERYMDLASQDPSNKNFSETVKDFFGDDSAFGGGGVDKKKK